MRKVNILSDKTAVSSCELVPGSLKRYTIEKKWTVTSCRPVPALTKHKKWHNRLYRAVYNVHSSG